MWRCAACSPFPLCAAGIALGICDMKMIEWEGQEAGGNMLDTGGHDADSGGDRGETGRLQEAQDREEQHGAVEQHGHPLQVCARSARAPSSAPVLRLMVNGEWVPLKVRPVCHT